jgi:hypothetical protein
MYNAHLENSLISPDIVDLMQDYCSIQIDIDETKIKAAALVAQNIDLKRNIKKDNLNRCIDPQCSSDEELRSLIIPAWCYYTYSRALKMFQGTLTDGGYTVEGEAESQSAAKHVANEMYAIAEGYIQEALEFLQEENPNTDVDGKDLTPSIRVFGGEEYRASN